MDVEILPCEEAQLDDDCETSDKVRVTDEVIKLSELVVAVQEVTFCQGLLASKLDVDVDVDVSEIGIVLEVVNEIELCEVACCFEKSNSHGPRKLRMRSRCWIQSTRLDHSPRSKPTQSRLKLLWMKSGLPSMSILNSLYRYCTSPGPVMF